MKYRCAGIVLYNPDMGRLKENIDAIYNDIDTLILVDNNSNNISDIEINYGNNDKVILIKNSDNKGIAVALNQIYKEAKEKGYRWSLFLDQDSVCGPNIFTSYSKYISIDKNIALLCPYIIDINKMTLDDYIKLNLPETSDLIWAITSGSFINLEILENLGGFDEYLFIDGVDIEFSKRLKINGYQQLRINNVYLLQEVGNADVLKVKRIHRDMSGYISWKPIYRTNHSQKRKYYMARNGILIAKKYRKYESYFLTIMKCLFMSFATIIIEKNKLQTSKSVFRGLYDGFKYKINPYKL